MTNASITAPPWRAPARSWPDRHDFGNAAIGSVDIAVGPSDHPSKTGPAVALHVRGESDPGKPGMSLTSLTIYDPAVLDRLIADLTAARAKMSLAVEVRNVEPPTIDPNQHCTSDECELTTSHTAGWCRAPQPRRCACSFCYPETDSDR